jgi:hypothetical protein
VRVEERQHESLCAGRVLMFVVTTRAVTVRRSLIVHVTVMAIVVVVDRPVLMAGLTTSEVGVRHGERTPTA